MRLRAWGAFAALALLAAPAIARKPPPPPPVSAGGLVDNVNGYAIEDGGAVRRFTGLLIDKAGKVSRLLAAGDPRPAYLDFRFDAQGRTLIPGLIDGHGQLMALGLAAIRLDLSGAASLAQAQATLSRYAADHPTPAWIAGSGWDASGWGRAPTAADLDAAVADRPVAITRADGQAVLANGAAMRAAGITAGTQPPPGGSIERDGAGRPTGLFTGTAQALIARAAPPPVPRQRDDALAKAQEMLLGQGLVGLDDMGTSTDDWNAIRRMADAGRLRLRIVAYAQDVEAMLSIAGVGPTPWLYGDRLRMVGVALSADGTLGARTAWLSAPYADAPGQRGAGLLDDAKLRNLMSRAAMDGFQVAVSATGDAANSQLLGAIEELGETYKGDRRWRIERALVVAPADLPRFTRNGIVASLQPVLDDPAILAARLGPARLPQVTTSAGLLRLNVPLVLGTGSPTARPDPFAALAAVAAGAQGAVPLPLALAALTRGAARAGFAEDRMGALAPGRYADFLILDRDILAPGADVATTHVLETWIGGQRAWVRKP